MTANYKNLSEFVFDPQINIHLHPDNHTIGYLDGGEAYILESMKKINDLSSDSPEFLQYIKDWPSRYHFSNKRVNFLEALKELLPENADVLEIGSGCGTITRWMGEHFRTIDALEGNASRAIITRYRTNDLDNVTVFCGDLLATGFDKKYDIITLIGSLEYIPLYDSEHNDPKQTCITLLKRLKNSLKKDGILLIAIENKFGAKYFSGCVEDHTGKEFEGIIGYPGKTPVTFSRNEIIDVLSTSGIGQHQVFHVFPDYKLTETVFPENAELFSLFPYNWIQTPFENYSGNRVHLFPDSLFLRSVSESGLFWQFSNSFVILAATTETKTRTVPWLMTSYKKNENLNPAFYHKITLTQDSTIPDSGDYKKYAVQRDRLFPMYPIEENENFKFQLINEEYVLGELLIFKFYSALCQNDPNNVLKQLISEFHNNLLSHYSIGMSDPEGYPLVKGQAIDYTFWNIIIDSQKIFRFIDRKWVYNYPLSADRILFRNFFNSYQKFAPFLINKDKKSFVLEMIQTVYPQYTETRLAADIEFEKKFQTFVRGKDLIFTIDSYQKQYSLSDVLSINQEIMAKKDELDMVITRRAIENQELARKMESLSLSFSELETIAKKKNEMIEKLELVIAAKVEQNQEIAAIVASKDSQLNDMSARLTDVEQKLSAIEKSIVWQLTLKFHYKIVEKILPLNTRRRGYYDLLRASGRKLMNEGFHSFHQSFELNDYQKWIINNEPSRHELNQLKIKSSNFTYRPKISLLMPVWNTDEKWLCLAIDSVIHQIYDNWELCIVEGGSTKQNIVPILKKYGKNYSQIKIKFLTENKGIAENSKEALSLATGEFIGFLDHDDELAPDALYEMVSLLNQNQNLEFIYSDEDKIDQDGNRKDPFFKPDWSPDYFFTQNYVCHFSIIRKRLVDSTGGFRSGYDGSQDYDLFLRCIEKIKPSLIAHIPKILYHWRIIKGSAAENDIAKPFAIISAKKALRDFLLRNNLDAEVLDGIFISSYRIRYFIDGNPKVSIIIPTKDQADVLKRCVQSILEKTSYGNYEVVIVDNQSKDPELFEYYKSLETNPKIKILHFNELFNYSKINNYAVSHVDTPFILFLNNDTEIISEEWLSAMLEHAQREDVGAVGAKLMYPNNLIQHAGVIIGLGGVAGHSHKYFPRDDPGYCNRLRVIQNFSAVTAACLLMRKETFQKIGGFNENYAIAFNDVDLCMKVRREGYRIVYTPYAQLYHHESLSRGYEDTPEKKARFSREVLSIRQEWGRVIDKGDPYYNPNLTLEREDFSIKE
jgi:GT2 family glycosyltransferase